MRPARVAPPRLIRVAPSTRLDALAQRPDVGAALVEAARASLRDAGNPALSLDAGLTGPAGPAGLTGPLGQALTTTLVALDAVLIVRAAGEEVAEPLAGFLSSSGVLLLPAGQEWLRLEIAPPPEEETSAYREAAVRGRRIGLALAVTRDGARIGDARAALGGVAPWPLRAREMEAALRGRRADAATINAVLETTRAEAQPAGIGNLLREDELQTLTSVCAETLQAVLAPPATAGKGKAS